MVVFVWIDLVHVLAGCYVTWLNLDHFNCLGFTRVFCHCRVFHFYVTTLSLPTNSILFLGGQTCRMVWRQQASGDEVKECQNCSVLCYVTVIYNHIRAVPKNRTVGLGFCKFIYFLLSRTSLCLVSCVLGIFSAFGARLVISQPPYYLNWGIM